jgi:ribose 5-phosphate isomerase A
MDEPKLLAARAAIAELPKQGTLGLGTGSTAKLFVDEVGKLVKAGATYRCVPTSEATRKQAEDLGIILLNDDDPWMIDVCVDGADEVDAALNLIKGGGGAMTREKIVNDASKRRITIVDESKLSKKLGEKWPIPIEILRFGRTSIMRKLERFGDPVLRNFVTDAGNLVVDLKVKPIDDPRSLDHLLHAVPGVVETGLFVNRADLVIVAGPSGVRTLKK